MKNFLLFILFLFSYHFSFAQEPTRKDSLQGGMRFERSCFNVLRYDLELKVDPTKKEILGFNDITFKVVQPTKKIQLDLFDNMIIDDITSKESGTLEFKRDENAVFILFKKTLEKDKTYTIRFSYHGNPIVARNAPWDGGWIWTKDTKGNPWMTLACQGLGASSWFPCKDHQSDEPENGSTLTMII